MLLVLCGFSIASTLSICIKPARGTRASLSAHSIRTIWARLVESTRPLRKSSFPVSSSVAIVQHKPSPANAVNRSSDPAAPPPLNVHPAPYSTKLLHQGCRCKKVCIRRFLLKYKCHHPLPRIQEQLFRKLAIK